MKKESDSLFGLGQPNTAFAKYFIGNSYLKPLNSKGVSIANVTFEPGCRNNWHIHAPMEKVGIKNMAKKHKN